MGVSLDHPLKVGGVRADTVFELEIPILSGPNPSFVPNETYYLCEMGLEEHNLVLICGLHHKHSSAINYHSESERNWTTRSQGTYVRRISVCPLHTKVVEQVPRSQIRSCLRNQLCPLHLRIPSRSRINRHFQSMCLGGISRVLVAWIQGEVM